MSNVAEGYAGAPNQGAADFPAGRAGPAVRLQGGCRRCTAPGRGGRGRAALTPEQLRNGRNGPRRQGLASLGVDGQVQAFRKMYEDAGVKIYAFKLPPTLEMSDQEYAYI